MREGEAVEHEARERSEAAEDADEEEGPHFGREMKAADGDECRPGGR